MSHEDPKVTALAKHFNVSEDTITDEGHDTYSCESEPGEYWVLTDEEADQAWDEELERYLDECVLCNIEGPLAQYFDRDAWKRDARHDGRGHCLSDYDSEEHEIKVDGEHFYIYRVN